MDGDVILQATGAGVASIEDVRGQETRELVVRFPARTETAKP